MISITPLTTREELDFAAQHGAAFYAETGMPGVFIPAKFVDLWMTVIDAGIGVILGLECNGAMVGWLAAVVAPDIYDGRWVAQECFWYTMPAHRGAYPLRLIRAYMEWAQSKGVAKRDIRIACMEGANPDHLEAFYVKLGFKPLERHFYYAGE